MQTITRTLQPLVNRIASGADTGGTLCCAVEATDGTDYISWTGRVKYSVVNKAGTFTWETSAVTKATNQVTAKSNAAHTMTNVITGNSGSLQLISTLGGSPAMSPTTFRVKSMVITNSGQEIIL